MHQHLITAGKNDPPTKARAITFSLVPDAKAFQDRPKEAWEDKLGALPGGLGGREIIDPEATGAASGKHVRFITDGKIYHVGAL